MILHRKLPLESLSSLTSALFAYVHALPVQARNEESDAMARFAAWGAQLDNLGVGTGAREVAVEIGEWLVEYMKYAIRAVFLSLDSYRRSLG